MKEVKKKPTADEAMSAIRHAIRCLHRKQEIHFPLMHQEWLNEIVNDLRDTGQTLWTSEEPDPKSYTGGTFTVGEGR